jgi:hypothetical protein
MDLDLYKSELCLTDQAPFRLLSARGVRITCTAGLVWLTLKAKWRCFLAPGQSHLPRPVCLLKPSGGAGSLRENRPPVGTPAGRGSGYGMAGVRASPAYQSRDRAAGVHNSRLFTNCDQGLNEPP